MTSDPQEGNYIAHYLKDDSHTIYLEDVYAEYCKPKPEECHCKTMLRNVLERFHDVDKIEGIFMASPFTAGCRCYLGAASRRGFRFVQFYSDRKGCNEKKEISPDKEADTYYGHVCESYKKQKKKCAEDLHKNIYGKGALTKL